jgi:GNAT superfamily N-acetyltransferase
MNIRNVHPYDNPSIITSLDDWWGGRKMSLMLPRLFFEHFCNTSFIIEKDGKIVAFLIGFLSQSQQDEAYIHFVGVHPQHRKQGYGRILYEHFFTTARTYQRHTIRCVTSPINKVSIVFHTHMDFQIEPGIIGNQGVEYDPDHDGPGEHRVCFVKHM